MASTRQENIVQDGTCILRKPAPAANGETLKQRASEKGVTTADIGIALENVAICDSGPLGVRKTYTGARIFCELVNRGKIVGVTGAEHKVIRNCSTKWWRPSREKNMEQALHCLHRGKRWEESDGVAVAKDDNDQAWDALKAGRRTLWANCVAVGAGKGI